MEIDRPIILSMKKIFTSDSPLEVLNPQDEDTPIPIKPASNTAVDIMFISWIFCGIVFFFGLFLRRLYLLEIVFPALAFVGFISFGIVILKGMIARRENVEKEKQRLERIEKQKVDNLDFSSKKKKVK